MHDWEKLKVDKPEWKPGRLPVAVEMRRGGFTLVELFVAIGVIVLLAALLLPALNNARHQALRSTCLGNLEQLGLGMEIYASENKGAFPGMAARYSGFNAADWIYWRTNPAYPSFEKSPVLTAVSGLQKPSLRCPLDISFADRLAQADPVNGPYLFSYGFTSYGVDLYPGLPRGVNLGMASVFTSERSYIYKFYAVRHPAAKVMLVEEPGSASESPDHASVISDGRWMPKLQPLANRHRGWAEVTFTDGHTESARPEFGNNFTNSLPDL